MSPELGSLQSALAGRYLIEREIGRGGMGVVFLGRDLALERPVAIKLLPSHLAGIPELRLRFLQEARTAARLAHPNIVPIHAVEEHGDCACFVMGYIPGETLADRVKTNGPEGPAAVARMVQEVAWALAYAHQQGIVHRDIKPANILIERGTGRALVMDFGIARVLTQEPITPPGERFGTAQYASPEQAAGEPADGRSDLYSLGVTAFYALTGRLPFEGESAAAFLAQHLTMPAPPVASLVPGLPRPLATAVDRCLAKDPAERFASGEDLASALAAGGSLAQPTPPLLARLVRETASFSVDMAGYGTLAGVAFIAQMLTASRDFLGFGQIYTIGIALVLLSLTALKGLSITQMLREAARQGWTARDIREAFHAEVQAEAAEQPAPPSRTRSTLLYLGGVAAMLALWLGPREALMSTIEGPLAILVELVAMVTPVALGRWFGARLEAPRDGKPGLLRRVMARKAEWFFRFFGRGSRHRLPPALPDERPTEMLLGDQAAALFAALPEHDRARLGEVGSVIGRLTERAVLLRTREADLGSMMASVGGPGIPARESVRQELDRERRLVADELGKTLAALDTLRLDLLRLRAGTATPEGLTGALEVVRRVGLDVDARLAALRELG